MGLDFSLEKQALTSAFVRSRSRFPTSVAGIDEVGVGPLAGPVTAAAVVLKGEYPDWFDEINDSKKLSPKKREELAEMILDTAEAVGFGWVQAWEIDSIGIAKAKTAAVIEAFQAVHRALDRTTFLVAVVDDERYRAVRLFLGGTPSVFVNKADSISVSVAAASIVAKVERDNWMVAQAANFPEYGFDQHKGYGTRKHLRAIKEHGPCRLHRLTFAPIKTLWPAK